MNLNIENLGFQKHIGTEKRVDIIKKTQINSGLHGDVFDALIQVGNKEKRFIIKEYGSPNAAERAFGTYRDLKAAGLKVFPTFRLGSDGVSILMTPGFSEKQVCIGSNNYLTLESHLGLPLEEIENLEEFLQAYFNEFIIAAEKGFGLRSDVPFYVITRNAPRKIGFVLGDLDNIRKMPATKETGEKNIDAAKNALEKFLFRNVKNEDLRAVYLEKVKIYFLENIDKVNNNPLLK